MTVPEAELKKTDAGLIPQGEGWFVLNARDASWIRSEERGQDTDFEGGQEWTQLGFRIQVVGPGQRGIYHGERGQEDFLVVSGECLLVIDGEERPLKAWDFVHCPPWTRHVFVGDGRRAVRDRHGRQPRGRLRGPLSGERGRSEARCKRARGDVEPGRGVCPLGERGAVNLRRGVAAVMKGPGAPTGGVVEEGRPAPDFTLTSDSGEAVTLSSFRGAPVVLYFYPRDDTPGCTAQACGIRDVWGELERKGAVVLGVSPDSPKKHAKFREKYRLPFTLLSDEDHTVAEAYATWVEKSMYGKKYMGMERSTFVIDADGNVARIMRKVKPADHADDVLAALP